MYWLKRLLPLFAAGMVVYLMGPHPPHPLYNKALPAVPGEPDSLQAFISNNEAKHRLKPDNEARIVWINDSVKHKTKYAIVYLPGFSASQEEGNPVHRNISKQFSCNLYLSRLAEHGIDTVDALVNLTADNYWESAKQAYAIGKKLGEKVILMGTSTGGTLALQLAAAYPDVAGVILLSPNIAINDPNAWLLNNPLGLQIAELVKHSKYNAAKNNAPAYKKYWNYQYRLEAAVALQELLETTMTPKTFKNVTQPVLTLYYYKDEQHQDRVVKVSAMKKMFNELGTASDHKRMVAIPEAGNHVIGSFILSHDIITPQNVIASFLKEVMHIQ